jgi:two-component system, sensor histidine kinase and response regulator
MDNSASGSILVVDDDTVSVEMCKHLLETEGYRVNIAANGKIALHQVRETKPDLILLDIIMPEMDGYETCRQLKRNHAVKDTPVIFMSSLTEPFDKVKAFSTGGVDFISKPIEAQELLARVQTQITLGQLQHELREINADLERRVDSRNRELSRTNEMLMAEIEERKETEKALTHSQRLLRALYIQLGELEEAERQRLARELHDQVGQNLTALGINLNVILNQLSNTSKTKVEDRLNDSVRILTETAGSIRDVMAALRPQVLDDYGLKAALQLEADRFSERTGISTQVIGKDISPRPLDGLETSLFRIAQEALTNVSKHGVAGQVIVRLEQIDDMVRLTIHDDGIGFDMEKLNNTNGSGWGLMTMRERIQAHDGSLQVASRPGKGTQIIVEVSL